MFNLSDKIVKSVYLDIECFDDAKDFVTSLNGYAFQAVNAMPQSGFGDKQPVVLDSNKIANVKFIIYKVVFFDDIVWRNEIKNAGIDLPAQAAISNEDTLYEQLVRECGERNINPIYWYESNNDYWRCTCGQANRNEILQCFYCSTEREWLEKHFDKQYLKEQAQLSENQKIKEEEQIRIEGERKAEAEREEERIKAQRPEAISRRRGRKFVRTVSWGWIVLCIVLTLLLMIGGLFKFILLIVIIPVMVPAIAILRMT